MIGVHIASNCQLIEKFDQLDAFMEKRLLQSTTVNK